MRAKFDRILVPIAGRADRARTSGPRIKFDAFFANVMFHEVAHGLGIKRTIDGKGTVREALKDQASALEEGKADILGLYMVTRLLEQKRADRHDARGPLRHLPGEHPPVDPLRRHRGARPRQRGPALLLRGAGRVQPRLGDRPLSASTFPKMRAAVDSLGALILRFQGDGDYEGVQAIHDDTSKLVARPCRAIWRGSAARASPWTSCSSRARPSWGWGASRWRAGSRRASRSSRPASRRRWPMILLLLAHPRRGGRGAVDPPAPAPTAAPRNMARGGGRPLGGQRSSATRSRSSSTGG